ncbi:MAG: hypothetical protein MI974_17555 [Chitinophagales bacterium]|nr:hypothetical protein [Chitinophagales bacterium]
MNKRYWIIIAVIFPALAFYTASSPVETINAEQSVAEVLMKLGEVLPDHIVDSTIAGVSIERGREIVHIGITSDPNGGNTNKQSKHFVCTSCHNMEKEDPDLRYADPQARLEYARDNGLPFLQGTTLYGAINRTNFYNGDYEKKYGELVKPARNDLREAIHLCAVECSQGRALEDWEMESVLAYLWTIDLKMGDLMLSDEDYEMINQSLSKDKNQEKAIALIKSYYLDGSPATFVTPPDDRKEGYPVKGDAANGKLIYELSCLHCHEKERYSFYNLDSSKLSFSHLSKHISRYTRYSIYQVGRWGTSPIPGKKAYMPNYTLEKMSYQQMEDLRAYIEQQAE